MRITANSSAGPSAVSRSYDDLRLIRRAESPLKVGREGTDTVRDGISPVPTGRSSRRQAEYLAPRFGRVRAGRDVPGRQRLRTHGATRGKLEAGGSAVQPRAGARGRLDAAIRTAERGGGRGRAALFRALSRGE